jgi:glucose 1-dehydrogenase
VDSTVEVPQGVIPAQLLKGRKALVTGANSGIGKATAIGLGRAGADVVVNYVAGQEAAEQMVEEITSFGVRAAAYEADVSNEDQVTAMMDRMVQEFGTIDILVANAGIQRDAPFTEMALDQCQKVLDVNLAGQFLCAREATKEFRRRGVVPEVSSSAGKIICMSSVHQLIPRAGHVNYAASKGGVPMMMETLAQELAPHKIRVNAVAPGAIRTPINRSAWETPEAREDLLRLIPYDRIGDPQDMAHAVVALASDLMDYVVGTTLYVDGGMTLFPASPPAADFLLYVLNSEGPHAHLGPSAGGHAGPTPARPGAHGLHPGLPHHPGAPGRRAPLHHLGHALPGAAAQRRRRTSAGAALVGCHGGAVRGRCRHRHRALLRVRPAVAGADGQVG